MTEPGPSADAPGASPEPSSKSERGSAGEDGPRHDPAAWCPEMVISGGQTGVDRAAFDAALAAGLPIAGWVPAGRWAEDGAVPRRYEGLRETGSAEPAERTEFNVRDSDATLIFSHGALAGGSALTERLALDSRKPCLHVDLADAAPGEAGRRVRSWLDTHRPRRLNVAGPRASEDPAIYRAVREVLAGVLGTAESAGTAGP